MWIFGWKGPSGFSARSTAEEVTRGIDASGLTAIVTGASSGIGVETARVLALRGAHVIMAIRNMDAGREVKESILKEVPSAKIDTMKLDLSSMASIRKFASDYVSSGLPLNILINNAGIWGAPFTLSEDGIELTFATNYLGHFLLTNLLLETMKNTSMQSHAEGRIINVASVAHRVAYHDGIHFDKINDKSEYGVMRTYGQSKLAKILHTKELARRLKEGGFQITVNSVHPGYIITNIGRHLGLFSAVGNWILKHLLQSVSQGAATTCYVALHPQVTGVSGEYFSSSNRAKSSHLARDADLAKKLWDFSINLTEIRRSNSPT